MGSLFLEDFEAGGEYITEARELTVADVLAFAEVSGDMNPLHLDDAYARRQGYRGRIAHGVLGLAVVTGLVNRSGLTRGTLLALLGVSWEFRRPVQPGDAVRARLRVLDSRRSRRSARGVVRLKAEALNQWDEVVQEGVFTLLVRSRPAPDPSSALPEGVAPA